MSTVGGTNYYLSEIRNIVKTKEDVKTLWKCDPKNIKILGIDLGQAYVVGASALIPRTNRFPETETTSHGHNISTPGTASEKIIFHNLAVKQKAVYQPIFKFRQWLEDKKKVIPTDNSPLIANIESSLPPFRGESISFDKHIDALEKVKDKLDTFYNGNNMLVARHQWDSARARDHEYHTITNRLLRMVGGDIGRKPHFLPNNQFRLFAT
jgi:hypothetical protein